MSTDANVTAFQQALATLDRDIRVLSDSDVTTDEFFRRFLERIVEVLGEGGAVLDRSAEAGFTARCHINLAVAGLGDGGAQAELLKPAMAKVLETSQPVILPANAAADVFDGGLGKAAQNRCPHTLLFVPILRGTEVVSVLLLISPTDVDPRAVRGYAGFVMGLCERAGSFLKNCRIKELEAGQVRSERFCDYLRSVHSELSPTRACYALANYGQELLEVYRCTAGSYNCKGRFRIEAVSGLESVAVKSSLVQRLARVAREVCRNNKPMMVDNPNAVQALQGLEDAEDDLVTEARVYMLEAGALVMGIFPICRDEVVVGALIVEKAVDEPFSEFELARIDALLSDGAMALDNSLRYRTMPLSPLTRGIGAVRDKLYRMPAVKRTVWLAVIAILLLFPLVVHRPVKVMGEAELVPVAARQAYVGQDGVIESVSVPEDRLVEAGTVLAEMDRRMIDTEIDRVENRIREAMIDLSDARLSENTTLQAKLEAQLKALRAELATYEYQAEQFEIRAPVAGKVITPQRTIRQLVGKPVTRGEAVLEIVPQSTSWELTVRVPEDESGDLLRSWDRLEPGEELPVRVILNAYPGTTFGSHVLGIAPRAHVQTLGEQKYRNVIEVRVAEPEGFKNARAFRDLVDLRKGLEGKVAIECESRSLYYVMTHEFVNFMRISLF